VSQQVQPFTGNGDSRQIAEKCSGGYEQSIKQTTCFRIFALVKYIFSQKRKKNKNWLKQQTGHFEYS
jgi:hypothetical protein